jgi:hypothetical protein
VFWDELFVLPLYVMIEESRAGRGAIGRLLNRTNALHSRRPGVIEVDANPVQL